MGRLQKDEEIISYKISKKYSVGTECYNVGFMAEDMPNFNKEWGENKIVINKCHNLEDLKKLSEGKIISINNGIVNANDIKIKNKKLIVCGYGGYEGMSGGPLIKKDSGEIIGMMSFGLPPDNKIKNKLFAVSIDEILKVVEEILI